MIDNYKFVEINLIIGDDMEIGSKPKEILKNILKQYTTTDTVLFQLRHKYMLHINLSKKYQFLEDDSLNEDYVKECIKKAMEVFRTMGFGNNLLVVYDDIHDNHGLEEKDFIESTLRNIIQCDNYKLKWKYPDGEDIYICNRHIYQVGEIDIKNLFREIVIADIGGKLDLISSIFIMDIDTKFIFHLYDDRGLFLYAKKEKDLLDVWNKFYDDIFTDCENFKIKVKDLYWINKEKDDSNDLCLHGDIVVTIGEEELSYINATVSASALRMLKTLTEEHLPTEGQQMLPCCGHTVVANESLDEVDIIGCDNGIDWTVLHDNGMIKLITESENTTSLYYLQYKEEVMDVANIVKKYYKESSPKIMPEDEFERNGYIAFWNEWNRRVGYEKRI